MITLDIETIPTQRQDVLGHLLEGVECKQAIGKDEYCAPPKNWKDENKIQAHIESKLESYDDYLEELKAQNAEKQNTVIHKTGLSGLFGQVLCIGYKVDDQPIVTLYADDSSEKEILNEFRGVCCGHSTLNNNVKRYCNHTLVGHNAAGFDVPFLSQRMMINGLNPLFRHGSKPWDMTIDDTMMMFASGGRDKYSLENLCLAFGIESPKNEIDGSQVWQAYQDGKHDLIREYCSKDVQATYDLYVNMGMVV